MAIIAEAARTQPHALRSLKLADEQIAGLSMLCGFDDGLAVQTTQTSNRIRGLLTRIHPGPRLDHPAILALLQRYPSPEKLASLSEKKPAVLLCKLAPRLGKCLAAGITQALTEQTAVVPGTKYPVIHPGEPGLTFLHQYPQSYPVVTIVECHRHQFMWIVVTL